MIYFGDTARLPYGTKSSETVRKFALQISKFLMQFPIKIIVVACNTASAEAVDLLQGKIELPIIGVVEPGARAGVLNSKKGRVGVIGTTGTIRSNAYTQAILRCDPRVKIFTQACPLFVPLVEEGWMEDEVTYLVARKYLSYLVDHGIDTLILGCTHYPLLKPVLQKVMGSGVALVDSATETATEVFSILTRLNLETDISQLPVHQYFVSDFSVHFKRIGEQCLKRPLDELRQVDLDEVMSNRELITGDE